IPRYSRRLPSEFPHAGGNRTWNGHVTGYGSFHSKHSGTNPSAINVVPGERPAKKVSVRVTSPEHSQNRISGSRCRNQPVLLGQQDVETSLLIGRDSGV